MDDLCGSRLLGARLWLARHLYLLLIGVVLVETADAQVSDESHRSLGFGGQADLRAQGELLERLRRYTGSGRLPNTPGLPPLGDPETRRAISQQVQQALRDLPRSSREPIEELIRQRLQASSGGLGGLRRPQNPTPDNAGPITAHELEKWLAGPDSPSSAAGQGQTQATGTDGSGGDATAQEQRIERLREVLKSIGSNGGIDPSAFNPERVSPSAAKPPTNTQSARVPNPSSTETASSSSQTANPAPAHSDNGNPSGQSSTPSPEPTPSPPVMPAEGAAEQQVDTKEPAQPDEPPEDVWTKFDRIIHVARKKDTAQEGARSALAQAIEDTANDWGIRAEELLNSQTEPAETGSSAEPGIFDRVGEATQTANDWAIDFSGDESPAAATPSLGRRAGSRWIALSGLALVVGLAVIAFAFLRNRNFFSGELAEINAPQPPNQLQTRRDVVQAFHALAARFPSVLPNWWPHRRAATALADANPNQEQAIHTLANLYEAARYMPEDAELTQDQLESARRAFRHFVHLMP